MVGPNLPVGTRVRMLVPLAKQRHPCSEFGTIAKHRPYDGGYIVVGDSGQGHFGWHYSQLALACIVIDIDLSEGVDDWDDWPLGPPEEGL